MTPLHWAAVRARAKAASSLAQSSHHTTHHMHATQRMHTLTHKRIRSPHHSLESCRPLPATATPASITCCCCPQVARQLLVAGASINVRDEACAPHSHVPPSAIPAFTGVPLQNGDCPADVAQGGTRAIFLLHQSGGLAGETCSAQPLALSRHAAAHTLAWVVQSMVHIMQWALTSWYCRGGGQCTGLRRCAGR